MTIEVGPHRFSITDARKTLAMAGDMLDFCPGAAQPALASLRAEIDTVIAASDTDDEASLGTAIREVYPLLLAARSVVTEADAMPATATGRVAQLSVSDGGVPKLPVDRVEIGFAGVTTDRQATRQHHGRPWQALCLWSAEVIDRFAAEGHPIAPGAAGENITVAGLDWSDVTGGVRFAIGSTLVQITAPAVPCKQNAGWFHDGDFDRMHHRHGPISRVYAAVIEPGSVASGDPVILEP